jgi:hypothetical protein
MRLYYQIRQVIGIQACSRALQISTSNVPLGIVYSQRSILLSDFCTKCIDISGNLTFQINITDTSNNIISSLPGGLSVSLNPDSGGYQTYFAIAPGSLGFEIILARLS